MYIKSYKELIVWQKSIALVKNIYRFTEDFPKTEIYGLSAQMRRSAISIPSNIAEGYKRRGRKEFLQFLSIAEASAAELETQIIITRELYPTISVATAESLLNEIQKMLPVMIQKLNAQR